MTTLRKFFSLPLGTRFKYQDGEKELVVIQRWGRGMVVDVVNVDSEQLQGVYAAAESEQACRDLEVLVISDEQRVPVKAGGPALEAAKHHLQQVLSRVWDGPLTSCASGPSMDGECYHKHCPQLRDNEPHATGRHCPLDTSLEDEQ